MLAVGVWTLVEKSDYISLLNSNFYSASAYILIIAGVVVIVSGIIGCCATLKEMKSLLIVVRGSVLKHKEKGKNDLLYHLLLCFYFYFDMSNQKVRHVYQSELCVENGSLVTHSASIQCSSKCQAVLSEMTEKVMQSLSLRVYI